MKQPAFGLRVRELRRAQGLSQAQLAGDEMSPSYISLLESGRRLPNTELARTIADRLKVPLSQLTDGSGAGRPAPHRIDLVGQLIAARALHTDGDLDTAVHRLETIVELADQAQDEDIAWEGRWELAAALRHAGRSDDSAAHLRELLTNPLTEDSAILHTQVTTALAAITRRHGQLTESLRYAEQATSAAEPLDADHPERVRAVVELLRAHLDLGDWDRALHHALDLFDIIDHVPVRTLRGLAGWTAGTLLFLTGDPQAQRHLDHARTHIAAGNDIRTWTALTRAAAAQHTAAGRPAEAADLLQRAQQAATLLDDRHEQARIAAVQAATLLALGEPAQAATHLAAIDPGVLPQLAQDQARIHIVHARIQHALGNATEAQAHYSHAATHYEQIGAYRLATYAWREATTDNPPPVPDPHALINP